ncbi:hypothetical protein DFH06DRAFT_1485330 [Mycena polygramma]|nr:hypothetical protein DFH06DRAFT_1485330 [Mycena polygramma]
MLHDHPESCAPNPRGQAGMPSASTLRDKATNHRVQYVSRKYGKRSIIWPEKSMQAWGVAVLLPSARVEVQRRVEMGLFSYHLPRECNTKEWVCWELPRRMALRAELCSGSRTPVFIEQRGLASRIPRAAAATHTRNTYTPAHCRYNLRQRRVLSARHLHSLVQTTPQSRTTRRIALPAVADSARAAFCDIDMAVRKTSAHRLYLSAAPNGHSHGSTYLRSAPEFPTAPPLLLSFSLPDSPADN